VGALIIVSLDMFLMVKHGANTPYFFFGIVIAWILYAVITNCKLCKNFGRTCGDINPFLSLVALGLGVYIVFLIENLLDTFLFTIHYYMWGLAVIFTLAFLYNVMKIIK